MRRLGWVPSSKGSYGCADTSLVVEMFPLFSGFVIEEADEDSPKALELERRALAGGCFEDRKKTGHPKLFVMEADGTMVWAACGPDKPQVHEAAYTATLTAADDDLLSMLANQVPEEGTELGYLLVGVDVEKGGE